MKAKRNPKRSEPRLLWDNFLNSDYHDWRGGGQSEDRLDRPDWLRLWLSGHGLPDPGPPTPEELARLKSLRTDMLDIVQTLVRDGQVTAASAEGLNRVLSEGPVIRRLVPLNGGGFSLQTNSLHADWPAIRAAIAASFGQMLAEGDRNRLRVCDNPDCLWVYYDETRNRSKRFCDDKMCGNLMKVRRFRARQKASAPVPPGGNLKPDGE
jgi:predicted RNA-binding Zn ribbon-like protein